MIIIRGAEWALEWEAFRINGSSVTLLVIIDYIRILFLSTVIMIAGSVFFYRASYIRIEKFSSRFSLLVISFVIRIVILIISPNLIRLLLGWDGLGVTSYLLVCYYRSEKRFNARILTALTNRLGDVAILLAIRIWWSRNFINYGLLRSRNLREIKLFFWVVIIAAITKRAQIPFSAWLPAAMAAPTPVSALVHSSTLVTAGVYLLIRFNYVITLRGYRRGVLFLGLITITMAGGSALMELDIKKIIALSTLRQLGVIFFRLGLCQPFLSFFHLVSHAYFKAMLFIAAGAIIHRVKDYQDLRKMGSYSSNLIRIGMVMLVRNLSLCGLPFISGFYSKDLILEILLIDNVDVITIRVAIVATLLTIAYSCRFALILFLARAKRESFSGEADTDTTILTGMRILVIPSIIGGWWLRGMIPRNYLIFLPLWKKLWILAMILAAGAIIILRNPAIKPEVPLVRALHMIWFLPKFISPWLTEKGLGNTKVFFKVTDPTWTNKITWGWAYSMVSRMNYLARSIRMGVMFRLVNMFVYIMV